MSEALLTASPAASTSAPAEGAPASTGNADASAGNAGQNELGKWVEQVPEAHRGYDFLKGKAKIEDFVLFTKSQTEELTKTKEAMKALEAQVPKRPGANATPEEVAKWKADNGLPTKPEDFVFKREGDIAALPENKEVDDFYRSLFTELEIPKDKGEALYAKFASKGKAMMEAALAARVEERKAAEAQMRQAYKGDYDAKMKTIVDFGKANFSMETWKIIEESGLGNRLDFADFLNTMGTEFGVGRFVKGSSSAQAEPASAADVLFPSLAKKL